MSVSPPDDNERLRRRSWSSYWASGALTSLPEDFPANYDGEIRDFWRNRCSGLADGASILDVCTGNGAIALLVADATAERGIDVRITAIDLAEIRPELIRQRFPDQERLIESIRFVGEHPFEDLALDDASQDLIVSQYGIEYCDPEVAARQCFRLLKPGGELAIVTHAPDSDMRATMQTELEQFQRLGELPMLTALGEWRDGRIDGAALKSRLAESAQALRREPALPRSGLFQYALGLCEQVSKMTGAQLDAQKSGLVQAFEQLEDGRSRLEQMLEVNRRLADPQAWAAEFENAGLTLMESGPLRYRGRHDVGQRFRFRRPSG